MASRTGVLLLPLRAVSGEMTNLLASSTPHPGLEFPQVGCGLHRGKPASLSRLIHDLELRFVRCQQRHSLMFLDAFDSTICKKGVNLIQAFFIRGQDIINLLLNPN